MIFVRQIREQDAPAFRDVLDAVCRERKYLAMLEGPPIEQVQSFVTANVKSGCPQFVAEQDGKIVGWCDALPGPAAFGMGHVGRLGMGCSSVIDAGRSADFCSTRPSKEHESSVYRRLSWRYSRRTKLPSASIEASDFMRKVERGAADSWTEIMTTYS